MKTTVAEFEKSVAELIRKQVKSVRSPFSAARIAKVNHEDNFVHYFGGMALDVLNEEFILLWDMKDVSDELLHYFNELIGPGYRIPLISRTLRAIWQEYHSK